MRSVSALKNIMAKTSAMSITETFVSPHMYSLKETVPYPTRKSFPAVWMRAGTSKGLFIQRKDLPSSKERWDAILLSAMGSSEGSSRQIDGVGGATSTTSKVAIVAKSTRPGADVDYTFVQVAPDQAKVDMTGNCGNIASGVGPFALDEGIVRAQPGQREIDIRVFNTNTQQTLVETVQVAPDGSFEEAGEYQIPGVEGKSSPIKLAFLKPGGSMTGKMFPSGKMQEILTVRSGPMGTFQVRVTLVDAANPFVLVDTSSLDLKGFPSWPSTTDPGFLDVVEDIRGQGAVQMGLAKDVESAGLVRGTPKIAFLSAPPDEDKADLQVLAFTLGKPHGSLQLTGAVCIGAAMAIHGTVAWELAHARKVDMLPRHGMTVEGYDIAAPLPVGIRHPAGVIHAETVLGMDRDGRVQVEKVAVFRTARRLFAGNVFYRA